MDANAYTAFISDMQGSQRHLKQAIPLLEGVLRAAIQTHNHNGELLALFVSPVAPIITSRKGIDIQEMTDEQADKFMNDIRVLTGGQDKAA